MSKVIVNDRLLKHLLDTFPNRLPPNKTISIEEIRLLQGEQRVIEYLQSLNEDQSIEEEIVDVL